MILSAYERADSPYVRIQFAPKNQPKQYVKTTIRKDDPDKALKVAKAINRVEAQLLSGTPQQSGASWNWVPDYLRQRYAAKKRTAHIYRIHWDWLSQYLRHAEIPGPGQLDRAGVFAYVDWRTSQTKQKSGRHPQLNTALGELKLLGLVMDEANRRGLATDNPARKLGIEREEPALKPEMNDTEIEMIYAATKPIWMFRSFHIGLHTALRFSDTAIERSRVNWRAKEIVIDRPKGGRKRAFSIQIYPSIRDMIEEFMDSGENVLWSLPAKERILTGIYWMRFFRERDLSHLCFHCTRVTFISRGARNGVPEGAMMKMVNHASKEIHRIYQRLASSDALRYRKQIPIPSYAVATKRSRRGKSSG